MIQDRDLAAPGTDRMPQGAMHIVGGGFAGGVQRFAEAQIRGDTPKATLSASLSKGASARSFFSFAFSAVGLVHLRARQGVRVS